MTLDQIVEEARQLPTAQVAELVDRLSQELNLGADIEESWKKEVRQRLADIETGRVQTIPGPEVSAKVRRIVGR
ncbi:MAG TPA: addiction module protein [Verrucomicrobiae bacterium]|nr:addiction module protein [Verrucomicrobiae bacterium]